MMGTRPIVVLDLGKCDIQELVDLENKGFKVPSYLLNDKYSEWAAAKSHPVAKKKRQRR